MGRHQLVTVGLHERYACCDACGAWLAVGERALAACAHGDVRLYCWPSCPTQRVRRALRDADERAWYDSQDAAPDARGAVPADPALRAAYRREALRRLGLPAPAEVAP